MQHFDAMPLEVVVGVGGMLLYLILKGLFFITLFIIALRALRR